jgi:chemotaxis protein MotA
VSQMNKPHKRFASTSIAGFAIAALCILGGLVMENGQLNDVAQVTAALIVFGGTAGAVLVGTPNAVLFSAFRRVRMLVWEDAEDTPAMIEDLIRRSRKARGSGILSLDAEIEEIAEPFLRKGMMLLVDGVEAAEIRRVMELDLIISENQAESDARVFETAAGLSPTIGIIGAVMGLIQVMKHLESLSEVGHGIAVAFVATVYGVGFANLILLPVANRIRTRSLQTSKFRELIVEGVLGIQAGTNPGLMARMLDGFAAGHNTAKKPVDNTPAVKRPVGDSPGTLPPANVPEAG